MTRTKQYNLSFSFIGSKRLQRQLLLCSIPTATTILPTSNSSYTCTALPTDAPFTFHQSFDSKAYASRSDDIICTHRQTEEWVTSWWWCVGRSYSRIPV